MPRYTNTSPHTNGNEYLKIRPHQKNVPSIYFYWDIPLLDMTDTAPYYNPVLFRDKKTFVGGESFTITLPNGAIGQNAFLFIQVIADTESMDDVEVTFNDPSNLPSLPISNSVFHMNNNHRVKRIYIDIAAGVAGEVIILATDK